MVERVNWSARVEVSAGPKLSAGDVQEVEAYDKLAVTLPAGATAINVELQPGAPERVMILVIVATAYHKDITYSPDGGTTKVSLDAPLTLIGNGAIGLLGTALTTLQWANGTDTDVGVEIFVGRNAQT